jgi:hypothetical protein
LPLEACEAFSVYLAHSVLRLHQGRCTGLVPKMGFRLCGVLNSCPLPDTDFLRKLRLSLAPQDELTSKLMKMDLKENPGYRVVNGLLYLLDERRYRMYIPHDAALKSQFYMITTTLFQLHTLECTQPMKI